MEEKNIRQILLELTKNAKTPINTRSKNDDKKLIDFIKKEKSNLKTQQINTKKSLSNDHRKIKY